MAASEATGAVQIVALGEPMVEFNQVRPGEPGYLQGFGGDTSNAIIAAARQGARTAYLTRVGSDTWGDALMELWRAEGVATDGVARDAQAPTAVYFVTHDGDGHAFSYLRAGSAASRMVPAGLPRDTIEGARFLHVSGISQAISASACDTVFEAIAIARAKGVQVSYDANLRLKLWPLARARAVIRETVGLSDLFLPSIEDAQQFTGLDGEDAILDWCFEAGARTVVLKLGKAGAVLATPSSRERIAGHAVRAVDATGAGDCFAGSLLARLAAGDAIAQAVRYANAAAALTTTGFGAVAPIPRPEDVRGLLATAPDRK
ncbi:sugar kinase [Variovorax sp.]|jgi:2-dehydro-3-deoxygluconokinase|uniref:sugar kinase n=1 Tax=Variovorax sp. TaxID=1871043 RepID=UPI000C3F1F5E|nr:sugar kinase [Variovorax sp.]MBS81278.1 2-dehydro-3-deoxygluconokinase [Variovorax sp.]